MTQAEGQGVRSTGEHVPACACTRLSVQRNTGLYIRYVRGRDGKQKSGNESIRTCFCVWVDTRMERGSEKWVNDKLGPASQSHFLNVLYPKSYKSNIPFWPYWSHFCKAITSVSSGISDELCLGFFFFFPFSFPPLYIYSLACYQRRVRACIQIGRKSEKQTTPNQWPAVMNGQKVAANFSKFHSPLAKRWLQ